MIPEAMGILRPKVIVLGMQVYGQQGKELRTK